MKNVFLVGIGGFIGSIARYLVSIIMSKFFFMPTFPIGTFIVNIVGSLIIGIIYALYSKGEFLTTEWRLFLATGFCGGFTTFSSFSYEGIYLIQQGEFFNLALYVFSSIIIGFASAYLGVIIVRLM